MPHVHDREGGADARHGGLDIADIFRRYGPAALERYQFSGPQLEVMRHITSCRTAELGGHLDVCDSCGFTRPSYNSCRDRHCPKCQGSRQAQWVALRTARMLPVVHYHVVFTVPGILRRLARDRRSWFFEVLFRASSDALMEFGRDGQWIGGQLGITAVLHTWTRDLRFHPHIHCIVTGGGLSADGMCWEGTKRGAKFLFPMRSLAAAFRKKVVGALRRQDGKERGESGQPEDPRFAALMSRLEHIAWNVHTEKPFGASVHLLKYLGRYTHRVGLSNQRLLAIEDDGILFKTKEGKTTRVPPTEFIRRFLDHVLPAGFVKVRHYGLYSAGCVGHRLEQARLLLPRQPDGPCAAMVIKTASGKLKAADWRTLLTQLTGIDPLRCPKCERGTMQRIEELSPIAARGPP